MLTAPPPLIAGDGHFGATLEPVLQKACAGRLSAVSWFRTDWQRGGALTGNATYLDEQGVTHEVVVKLPVPPCERQWLAALQDVPNVVPRVHAHGEALNGYDLAWVVMERLPHGPLGATWEGREFDLLVEAAVRFYAAADRFPHLDGKPQQQDWHERFEQARQAVRHKSVPDAQRWNKTLKKAHRKLKKWVRLWEDRPIDGWCHGDLHLANALSRTAAPAGPALLIDFARTRIGHWLEDAIYSSTSTRARRDRLQGRKLCRQIAHERKRLGLTVDKDWAQRAEAKRALLAMATPTMLRYDGDPHHLAAALDVLEHATG